ncbi:MAG TPA: hypothetical protein VFW83_11330 [Bryobacteraceae bacterium]|nr:hypothetical protein [Bryobacteraceae bacterium]
MYRSRPVRRLSGLALAVGLGCLCYAAEPAPVHLTSQQDRQRTLDLLHIASLRPGANANNPQAPNAVNYDESKANPYPNLPDPEVFSSLYILSACCLGANLNPNPQRLAAVAISEW